MIKKIINNFEKLFNDKYDAYQFSIDMPAFVYNNYDLIAKENKKIAYYLDQNLPDICDEAEPNFDARNMINKLQEIYKEMKTMF